MGRSIVRLVFGALLSLAVCGSALGASASGPAQAATTWQVKVGGASADLALQAQAFLPTSITINAGDTINWTFAGPHTATFLSGGAPPQEPLSSPEGPVGNPAVFFGVGGPTYDGTGYANSGVLGIPGVPPTFALTFTKAGTYGYVCLLHPGMEGQVVVQAADSAYPMTQAQVDAQANTELYSKLGHANTLLQSAKLTSQPGQSGTTSYTVANGVGGNQATVLRFLPVDVTVKAGDSITWTQNDPHEAHTVTFYDPAGPVPAFIDIQPQPNGPPKVLYRNIAPSGGTAVTGPGLFNSGFQLPGQSYTFSFPTPGVYKYVCVLHAPEGMFGSVTVTGAATTPASLPRTGDGDQSTAPLALAGGALILILLGALLIRRRAR